MRRFVGIDLGRAPAPDETTILNFRHLLEEHELCGQMLDTVNRYLESKGTLAHSYEREVTVYDPLHYLVLLEHKPRALDQAAPLAGWQLPECFAQLRRLLETFPLIEVTAAIEQALELHTISFDAVRHLVLCRIERRPPRLDMTNWPHLPLAQMRTTRAADYMSLLCTSPEPSTLDATP